jgi:Fe-S-cluster containining protein
MANRNVYGTEDLDAPVTRADFERALRHLNLSDIDLRDAVLQLAARFVALTDELTRRIDHVEPEPAAPNTPATPTTQTVEWNVNAGLADALRNVRVGDAAQPTRVSIDLDPTDKYTVENESPPCEELFHLCKARCCRLTYSLSTQDLDEGVIRWDYGQPYLIRQRASDGYCVHNDPATGGCTVHANRPRVCRSYHCRDDHRVWIDYDKRIPAPHFEGQFTDDAAQTPRFDLLERARMRAKAIMREKASISETFADPEPRLGPEVTPRTKPSSG